MDSDNSGESDWAFDGFGNLYDLSQPMEIETYGPPPTLRWVPPVDLPQIFGLRCARAGRRRVVYNLRCASEVFESDGGLFVNVVDEDQWYRWLEVPESRRPERRRRGSGWGGPQGARRSQPKPPIPFNRDYSRKAGPRLPISFTSPNTHPETDTPGTPPRPP